MSVVVQKFGGTSVANSEKIVAAAQKAIRECKAGHQVVMVVSAMGKNTDGLIALAKETMEVGRAQAETTTGTQDDKFATAAKDFMDGPLSREMDMLLSTGEQVSVALMAMAVHELGYKSVSMTGAQIGITTDQVHTKARIKSISTDRMRQALDEGNIVIAAGFQGVDDDFNITTLGRGGSDTTAVALAAVLNADFCDIYTDVDGVYSMDPKILAEARRMTQVSYDEMLELASLGASVMHSRSIEFARNFNVPVRVRASFADGPGTMIVAKPESMSRAVCGAAIVKDEVRMTLRGVPDHPGAASDIFTPLAEQRIVVDMIVQNISTEGVAEICFTIPKADFASTMRVLQEVKEAKPTAYESINHSDKLSKISIVGSGMAAQTGVAEKMFRALAEKGINIQMISTSAIRISVLVDQDVAMEALRTVHKAFELEKAPTDLATEKPHEIVTEEEKVQAVELLQEMQLQQFKRLYQQQKQLERLLIDNIEMDDTQARITLSDVPNTPGLAAKVFKQIKDANVMVDMIVQSQGEQSQTSLSFTVPRKDAVKAAEVARALAKEFGMPEPKPAMNVDIISLRGTGMRSHTNVSSQMLGRLAAEGINIEMINTSEVCFSAVVAADKGEKTLAALKDEFKQ